MFLLVIPGLSYFSYLIKHTLIIEGKEGKPQGVKELWH